MIYAVSNLQGCYEKYKEILEEIEFSKKDLLFVLGDIVDGGEDGIKILFDMMLHENIFPILGDHDYIAYEIMAGIEKETKKDISSPLSTELAERCQMWTESGGEPTLDAFSRLAADDRSAILEYLEEFTLYEEVEANGKEFVLAHNMPADFISGDSLEDFTADEILSGEINYNKNYFPGKILVTAHDETREIGARDGKIFKKGSNVAINCGVFYGGFLAAYCLDTGKEFYVNAD
ncbi:MAG: metallophosphoesterase [Clostridia bacterium]|nr:metallophosphoesterase [Clostridia bacterium]